MTQVPEAATALYRMYGHDGALLYVGITCDIGSRFTTHSADKPWWTEVARIEIEHYPTREAALAAERAEIKARRPRWNIIHNHDHPAPDRGRLARMYAELDPKVRVLVAAGLDGYDIQCGLRQSASNIAYSLERLLEEGLITEVPPRRHPGSARTRNDSLQRAQADEILASAEACLAVPSAA
jgi:predicted GIY-YIG superfamily endonuclease